MINEFYPAAYQTIRSVEAGLNVPESDQLRVQYMSYRWGAGDPRPVLNGNAGVLYDDHHYYEWPQKAFQAKDDVITAVCSDKNEPRASKLIVGECSMAVKAADGVKDFLLNPNDGIDIASQKEWYKKFWGSQAWSYERGGGWIFWTWKCETMWKKNGDEENHSKEMVWCYRNAVENGIIPGDASQAASFSSC